MIGGGRGGGGLTMDHRNTRGPGEELSALVAPSSYLDKAMKALQSV